LSPSPSWTPNVPSSNRMIGVCLPRQAFRRHPLYMFVQFILVFFVFLQPFVLCLVVFLHFYFLFYILVKHPTRILEISFPMFLFSFCLLLLIPTFTDYLWHFLVYVPDIPCCNFHIFQ
jgi:energy-coupling factor transporter transmembrane protein EcfT